LPPGPRATSRTAWRTRPDARAAIGRSRAVWRRDARRDAGGGVPAGGRDDAAQRRAPANPSALPNLIKALRARTTLDVEPQEVRLTLDDDRLWDHPFLYLTGHGQIRFSEHEVERLRQYLLQGGFLHADDNYGLDAAFRREIARVFPDRELVDVPVDHPIYRIVYPFPQGVPKIHEHDGKPPRGYGIFIGNRLAVYYTHEADLGNGWEDVGTYPEDPPELHEQALRMGVNLYVYAVTSGVGR
jgi:hypothetical protein